MKFRFVRFFYSLSAVWFTCIAVTFSSTECYGQSVCLPAPRLLTTMPMGGQAGTEVEVAITGQHIEDIESLLFSHPGITATEKLDANGKPEPNKFIVKIVDDCPLGIHEARVMSRLGVSSSRVFTVSSLPEVKQDKATTTVATAMPLEVNSVCNATLPVRAVNHYSFAAKKDQRILVDCSAKGIESKMNPVVIVADAKGNDLVVERRGGALDFTAPENGTYIVKVHELTFQGGPYHFYRLALQELAADAPIKRAESIRSVSSFSWPPAGLTKETTVAEVEPNNKHSEAAKITLPADIMGSFYPAADVDTFEFTARKGETWWIEVASERLGRPTDPSIVVQQVTSEGGEEKLVDIVELSDIASPVKRSSNGYAYDGPPYNAGSSDILGKVDIKEDGTYRLQISDLFGGTRNDPRNEYRMIIRKAAPDFALVSWALHMGLRNGDRNALSKPIALRGGATVAFEVIAVRRDGFDGEIELSMENLPSGVTATGLKIAKGKTNGVMLITAAEDAPRGLSIASMSGRAVIDGKDVVHECQMASMAWPVANAWSEIPAPRLLADIPVSVGASELAGITIAAKEDKVWEAKVGETLKIPLTHTQRGEFSGAAINMRTFGAGFEGIPRFDAPLNADQSEVTIDLAKLKTQPGDYKLSFYGGAVEKYRYNPQAVTAADFAYKRAQQQAAEATGEDKKPADAAVVAAKKVLDAATKQAQPKDIADIIVCEPISIRVLPAETP